MKTLRALLGSNAEWPKNLDHRSFQRRCEKLFSSCGVITKEYGVAHGFYAELDEKKWIAFGFTEPREPPLTFILDAIAAAAHEYRVALIITSENPSTYIRKTAVDRNFQILSYKEIPAFVAAQKA